MAIWYGIGNQKIIINKQTQLNSQFDLVWLNGMLLQHTVAQWQFTQCERERQSKLILYILILNTSNGCKPTEAFPPIIRRYDGKKYCVKLAKSSPHTQIISWILMEYGVIGSVFIFPIHRDNSGALQIATTMEREEKRSHTHETMPRSSNSVREKISFRHNVVSVWEALQIFIPMKNYQAIVNWHKLHAQSIWCKKMIFHSH